MWTQPKPIVKTDISYQPYRTGQKIASIYVCISYETGLPLYYRVVIGASAKDHNFLSLEHNFLSLEEAMVFCDINDYYVDTIDWGNPEFGINKFYSPSTKVKLEDGRVLDIGN